MVLICTPENECIGWCTSYTIDENYTYSEKEGKCAIGIDIPEKEQRRKGYASHALCLFIDYLLKHGEKEIYTQTWSGNERMIRLAEKIGFEECNRKPEFRTVRGEKYDGLTFQLNLEKFEIYKAQNRKMDE